jgi:hypothetical protein
MSPELRQAGLALWRQDRPKGGSMTARETFATGGDRGAGEDLGVVGVHAAGQGLGVQGVRVKVPDRPGVAIRAEGSALWQIGGLKGGGRWVEVRRQRWSGPSAVVVAVGLGPGRFPGGLNRSLRRPPGFPKRLDQSQSSSTEVFSQERFGDEPRVLRKTNEAAARRRGATWRRLAVSEVCVELGDW